MLTVKQLREMLANVSDNYTVVIQNPNDITTYELEPEGPVCDEKNGYCYLLARE